MPRVVKRSASHPVKSGPSHRGAPLPPFVPPQLSQPVETPPSGPQWVHEIKLTYAGHVAQECPLRCSPTCGGAWTLSLAGHRP
jgi:hypothetical protein